jgi:Hypothetical glycosyl hydrolase family 15
MFCPLSSKRLLILITVFLLFPIISACNSYRMEGLQKSSLTATPTPIRTPGAMSCNGLFCSAPLPGMRPFIDTANNIHVFQSFDYHISDPTTVAQYYDFIWGVIPSKVAAFRSGHPGVLLSYYMPFHDDNGAFAGPEAGTNLHGLKYWKSFHPDWVLYKCDRVTPAFEYGNPNMPLDFSNPDVLSWQLQTYALPADRSGYDAIAVDNLNIENLFGACGFYRNGKWVQRYTGEIDDPQWHADIISWLTRMQTALRALPHPLELIPNLGFGAGSPLTDPTVQQIVSHSDGILDERGFTDYGHNYITGDNWLQTIQFIKSVQQQHKAYYIVNQFPSVVDHVQIEWALASYLLCKEHLASVFISGVQDYGRSLYYPEYSAPIGSSSSEIYQSQHVYVRDYSNGLVMVNPSDTQAYTVRTSFTGYRDLSGNPVSRSFTISPHSGMILIG